MAPVGAPAAFVAGIASFLSPCVLPLVPGYICFLSGMSLDELQRGADRRRAMIDGAMGALFFVLGFTVVFTALGATASEAGRLLSSHMGLVTKLAGAVIIVFGLHTAGIAPIRWFYYHKRIDHSGIPASRVGAFLVGLAFACGWTPCIGPILASILALAATEGTVAKGMALLAIYSLGLGIPFILTGLAVEEFLQLFAKYKRYIGWGERISGVLLVAGGLLIFFNRLTFVMRFLPRSLTRFAL